METMTENYLDLTIDEVYDVITNINIWPQTFDKSKRRYCYSWTYTQARE